MWRSADEVPVGVRSAGTVVEIGDTGQLSGKGIRAVWHRLWPLIKPARGRLLLLGGGSVLTGLLEAAVLVLLVQIALAISSDTSGVSIGLGPLGTQVFTVTELFGAAVFCGLLRLAIGIAIADSSPRVSGRILASYRREAVSAFLAGSWAKQEAEKQGHFQDLATGHTSRVAQLALLAVLVLGAAGNLASIAVSALVVNAAVAIGLVLAVAVLLAVLRPLASRSRAESARFAEANRTYAGLVSDIVRLARELKVFRVEAEVAARADDLVQETATAYQRNQSYVYLLPALYQGLTLVLILMALALLHTADLGSPQSLGAVVLLLFRGLSYGQNLQHNLHQVNDLLPYVERVQETIRGYEAEADPDGVVSVDRVDSLEFADVSFDYGGRPALRNVSWVMEQGECVGVVGPSGAGKSTLVQIILRLRKPTSGRFSMGSQDVADIRLEDWRRLVSYVPQDPDLIDGTVAENIRFFREEISDDAVRRSAESAHLHDEIMALPDGYETIIGPREKALSGGQKQRLCLARALAGGPSLLILDEPTSALDLRSEKAVHESLEELKGEVTLVIVAHRMSTLKICDRIMVLERGELKAFMEADQLAESSEFFREALDLARGA